ncbi:MAG: hypothetical protein BIFFINMI_04378 [Phycisphaerae bacterium]|nr:hypothetical protein [Phycisphaerae bacterium]
MGVLTDFIVANRAEAQRVFESSCPSTDFAGLDAKGIDTVKLGTLHAILTGTQFDPTFISDTLVDGGEDGPWVFEVPMDLVQRLGKLDAQQLQTVGVKWAATEEFSGKFDNWPSEAVLAVLQEISALCKRAVQEGKALLMWMCL